MEALSSRACATYALRVVWFVPAGGAYTAAEASKRQYGVLCVCVFVCFFCFFLLCFLCVFFFNSTNGQYRRCDVRATGVAQSRALDFVPVSHVSADAADIAAACLLWLLRVVTSTGGERLLRPWASRYPISVHGEACLGNTTLLCWTWVDVRDRAAGRRGSLSSQPETKNRQSARV